MHPTSLPGPYGVGDLGRFARAFVDALQTAGQRWWQMLPLQPTGFGGSPYSALSAFAGNPILIDLEALVSYGWLAQDALDTLEQDCKAFPETAFCIAEVSTAKEALLDKSFEGYLGAENKQPEGFSLSFSDFCEKEKEWLDDFALFIALKEDNGGKDWREWSSELVAREPKALAAATKRLEKALQRHKFFQWVFSQQWDLLRKYAAERKVLMIGDIPIFVAMDSVDVWARRELFLLDEQGNAKVVSGVPPDYFSKTGQKWGNPLYDWDHLKSTDYRWWFDRVRQALKTVDLIRIDHFRGFESYWEVPADAPTAEKGQWLKGPGDHFFETMYDDLGELPLIAEDLGIITDEVIALRDRQRLPGMKILQFAFDGNPDHPFLPHTYPENCVAYTGTHDNDTTQGWYNSTDDLSRHRVRTYLSHPDEGIVWRMMQAILDSKARMVLFPVQDLFTLGSDMRMNTPGIAEGNWGWRLTQAQLEEKGVWERLGGLCKDTHRIPELPPAY